MKDLIIIKQLHEYLYKTAGVQPSLFQISQEEQKKLPFYMKETYWFYFGDFFFGNEFTLMIPKHETLPTIGQLKKNMETIKDTLHRRTVLVYSTIPSYIRNRLIQKQINFIVPGRQMFMPNIRVDLNEKEYVRPEKTDALIPSAQFIVLYQILKRNDTLEEYSLKELAEKFGYSAMAITKVVKNLIVHELCEIEGNKEKYLRFNQDISELWYKALPLMASPVLKQVFIEKYPEGELLFPANTSALPEYTDMNPSKQEYYAIEKNKFYMLEKENKLQGLNEFEGRYCLEIWKYDPCLLMQDITEEAIVDPLSLYLSFTDNQDERIEMALEQIIKKYIW